VESRSHSAVDVNPSLQKIVAPPFSSVSVARSSFQLVYFGDPSTCSVLSYLGFGKRFQRGVRGLILHLSCDFLDGPFDEGRCEVRQCIDGLEG